MKGEVARGALLTAITGALVLAVAPQAQPPAFALRAMAGQARQPGSAATPTSQPPGGRGRGAVTSPRNAYPDRPPGDPAAIERGKAPTLADFGRKLG